MNSISVLENLEKTLSEIKEIDPVKGRTIMENYDSFIDEFQLEVKMKSVSLHLAKALTYYVKENEILEKDSLFHVYCEIKDNNISDEDLRTANLPNYTTADFITIAGIEKRLTELGWLG